MSHEKSSKQKLETDADRLTEGDAFLMLGKHLQFISCFIHTPNIFPLEKVSFFSFPTERRALVGARGIERERTGGQMRIVKDVCFSIESLVVRWQRREERLVI